MSLQYVIDGYNIIKHPEFSPLHRKHTDARRALVEFIREKKLCGSPKNKITIVFDGYAPSGEGEDSSRQIEIIFSQARTADEKIKNILEKTPFIKTTVVVSDDKEIKLFARLTGAASLGVSEFISKAKKIDRALLALKPEITYSQMHKINEELRKLWLK
ncbi:MAG: NYN domain-containing protein [Candidatus Omnitrophota bacterium]